MTTPATGWVYRTEPTTPMASTPAVVAAPAVSAVVAPVVAPQAPARVRAPKTETKTATVPSAPAVTSSAPQPRYVPAVLRTLLLPLALIAICTERR